MTVQEKEQLIKEKEAEIKRLKQDIAQIRGKEIKTVTKNELLTGVYLSKEGNVVGFDHWDYDIWPHIRWLAQTIYIADNGTSRIHCKRIKQKDMTQEQRNLSGQFADEAIALFNKYVRKANKELFGGEE